MEVGAKGKKMSEVGLRRPTERGVTATRSTTTCSSDGPIDATVTAGSNNTIGVELLDGQPHYHLVADGDTLVASVIC